MFYKDETLRQPEAFVNNTDLIIIKRRYGRLKSQCLVTVHRSRKRSQELRTVDQIWFMFLSDRKDTVVWIRPFNENESKNVYGGGNKRWGSEQGGSKMNRRRKRN